MSEHTKIRVKPLEWESRQAGANVDFTAESAVGLYEVGTVHTGHAAILRKIGDGDYEDIVLVRGVGAEKAKAAAQADYERRIISAIEPDPAACNSFDDLVAALRMLRAYCAWQRDEGGSCHPTLNSAIDKADAALYRAGAA